MPVIVDVTLRDAKTGKAETLTCTPEHPLYVQGQGWVEAGSVGIGTSIVSRAGPALQVTALTWKQNKAEELAAGTGSSFGGYTVYNLTVEDDHTFFVGNIGGGTWVHNNCDLASPQARTHILDGDGNGGGHRFGTGNSGKTEFPASWSDDQTMEHISDIATDPTSFRTNETGPEGSMYTKAGNPAMIWAEGVRDGTYVRVLTEPAGRGIVTAFPPKELGYPVNP